MIDEQVNETPKEKQEHDETTTILGVPFCRWSQEKVTSWIKECLISNEETIDEQGSARAQQPKHIVTANPEIVMGALADEELMQALLDADLITPDGTGIVWAADYLGQPVAERVAGYDLFHDLCRTSKEEPFSIYLLGAKEETNRKAAIKLESLYPQLQIVGRRNGYFTIEEEQAIIEEINRLQPDLLLVALGFPKQEIWIYQHKADLQVKVAIGVGGSFDVLAGTVKRAPQLWQKWRIEWLYRLLQEPSRWKRQMALPKFVLAVRRYKKGLQNR